MMICSERTRDSRGARPGLWQRAGLMLACLVGGLSVWAQPATAQHVDYFWSVVEGSTTLLPGESVTLQLNAERDMGAWYWGGSFQVLMDGWGADDTIITNTNGTFGSENPSDTATSYLGRRDGIGIASFRNFPSIMAYNLDASNPDHAILGSVLSSGGIDHSVGLSLNGFPSLENPIGFFRIRVTAGSVTHNIIFNAAISESIIASNILHLPTITTSRPLNNSISQPVLCVFGLFFVQAA